VSLLGSSALLQGCAHPSSAEEGRVLYDSNGCAACHGRSGRGDGPMAATLPARPIDLRNKSLYSHGSDEAAIAKTLADGISILHVMPELQRTHHMLVMPKFDHLTEAERRSIALYLISTFNRGGIER
jgi:mono/diheme cytochrome c family protein